MYFDELTTDVNEEFDAIEVIALPENLEEILEDASDDADLITTRLLEIVAQQNLLEVFDPREAVLLAKELWDAARSVAAGVVSAHLSLSGIPFDVSFVGQEL